MSFWIKIGCFRKNLSRISVLNDNYTDKQCEFSGEFVEEQEYEYFKCFLSKLKRINEKFVARAVKEEFDNEMREIKQHEEKNARRDFKGKSS